MEEDILNSVVAGLGRTGNLGVERSFAGTGGHGSTDRSTDFALVFARLGWCADEFKAVAAVGADLAQALDIVIVD